MEEQVRRALDARDHDRLEALARAYDQEAPDPEAPARLRSLAETADRIVGFIGKLIPQKGVHLLIEALCLLPPSSRGLVVGFGTFREWLQALVIALDAGDAAAVTWIAERTRIEMELTDREIAGARGLAHRVTFTGRLDHRYAPGALAAMDVLVVPSVLDEAFGMVAVEGAAAGAVPILARHSGLAEVAAALERTLPSAGPFGFEPGGGAVRRLAQAITPHFERPLDQPGREALHRLATSQWSWDRTAESLLRAGSSRGG
jgi:glycosyltransferase involved in cell wall biosynthesis